MEKRIHENLSKKGFVSYHSASYISEIDKTELGNERKGC